MERAFWDSSRKRIAKIFTQGLSKFCNEIKCYSVYVKVTKNFLTEIKNNFLSPFDGVVPIVKMMPLFAIKKWLKSYRPGPEPQDLGADDHGISGKFLSVYDVDILSDKQINVIKLSDIESSKLRHRNFLE